MLFDLFALCGLMVQLVVSVCASVVRGVSGRYSRPKAVTNPSTNQTCNWVIGSPGQWVIWVIFHVLVTGSSF